MKCPAATQKEAKYGVHQLNLIPAIENDVNEERIADSCLSILSQINQTAALLLGSLWLSTPSRLHLLTKWIVVLLLHSKSSRR